MSNFVSIVNLYCNFYGYKKRKKVLDISYTKMIDLIYFSIWGCSIITSRFRDRWLYTFFVILRDGKVGGVVGSLFITVTLR